MSQNGDLWFTLSLQQSLLASWLFSAIPIPCLKILVLFILVIIVFNKLNNYIAIEVRLPLHVGGASNLNHLHFHSF